MSTTAYPPGARVAIVESGANLASLAFALERLAVPAEVTLDAARIRAASHVILPGVGAAASAMHTLRRTGLAELIPTLRQPVLGICLGLQLLHEASDEGDVECLGVIAGRARPLSPAPGRPVPHMGWNSLEALRPDPLLEGIEAGARVYFVHGYALPVTAATVAACDYGATFGAVVRQRNFAGVQFHPERSGAVGARLLGNFLAQSALPLPEDCACC